MKRFIIFPLFISFLFLVSCFDRVCPDFDLENGFSITFRLFESGTDNSLLGIGTYYDRDSVKVFYEDGEVLFDGPVYTDGTVTLEAYFLKNIELPLDKDSSEVYYLHLRRGFLDVDTFEVSYRVSKAECNQKIFTEYNFIYNGELIRSINDEIDELTICLEKPL